MTTTLEAPTVHTAQKAVTKTRRRPNIGRFFHGWTAVALFIALWELVPRFVLDEDTRVFLPPVSEDLAALWDLVLDGQLAEHVEASIGRSAAGFAVSVADQGRPFTRAFQSEAVPEGDPAFGGAHGVHRNPDGRVVLDPGAGRRGNGRREGRARLPHQHQPGELPDSADVRRDHRGLGARPDRQLRLRRS